MLSIRERAPLRLSVGVQGPDGRYARWGIDEPDPENVPSSLTFSSTMPGGFEQMSCTLERKPSSDFPDLNEFSTITVYGAGGQVAWQGRLETTPRTSGDQMNVTPGAVGWQAHLDDDSSAREIFIDCDLSNWQGASTQRQLQLLNGNIDETDASASPDPVSGQPSLVTQLTGAWSRFSVSEGWYDAKGIPIADLYYAWKLASGIGDSSSADTNWLWTAGVYDTNLASGGDVTANLRASGPGTGALAASATTRIFAMVQLRYGIGGGNDGVNYPVFWTYLGVVGQHGIPIQGTLGQTGGLGVLASDVIMYAVRKWAPQLAFSTGSGGTIEASAFPIPQLAFTTPTTVSNMITQALSYELMDWWVDEGGAARIPTFNLASRANHGRDWRARVGPSGLNETGPQVERMYDSIIVAYNDTAGVARTVGPPGSLVDTVDATLQDTDPANPVNVAGLSRPYEMPNIGTSTAAGAIRVGQNQLADFKAASTAGQAQITGHVQDSSGVWWPAWMIRAGDWIVFTDAHDTSPRRITQASYDDSTKQCQITLDSPPQTTQALLARMAIALTPVGF